MRSNADLVRSCHLEHGLPAYMSIVISSTSLTYSGEHRFECLLILEVMNFSNTEESATGVMNH